VVDINTNPENPVISVRAFGEDRETVSHIAGVMIDVLRTRGIMTCAKHFPGHGDTAIDSHLSLPSLQKSLTDLEQEELYPFKKAAGQGVDSMMLAHMSVPAIDSEGIPLSISAKAVAYIREKLDFQGLLMTDALNMGGISPVGESEAGLRALEAGVDILLHPSNPYDLNDYLKYNKVQSCRERIDKFRSALAGGGDIAEPQFAGNALLSREVSEKAVKISLPVRLEDPSSIVIIREKEEFSCGIFENFLKKKFPLARHFVLKDSHIPSLDAVGDRAMTVLFSKTAAWKGQPSRWFRDAVKKLGNRTRFFVILGNPYIAQNYDVPKIYTYWCSEEAEKALIKRFDELTA
jgi:hypothetical protein